MAPSESIGTGQDLPLMVKHTPSKSLDPVSTLKTPH